MDVQIKWFSDNFNVILASKEGAEPFLEVKGCRIVNGSNGPFVSYPSKKLDSGKYWNHVYGSERFNAVVLEKAQAAQPAAAPRRGRAPAGGGGVDMDDIPFTRAYSGLAA
jgi:DNA-binding cell septation regulator SpoVG